MAGQAVPQLHFHIIPCYGNGEAFPQGTVTEGSVGASAPALSRQGDAAPSDRSAPSSSDPGTSGAGASASGPGGVAAGGGVRGGGGGAGRRRRALTEAEAGPLIARLRNLLAPSGYSSPPGSFHVWAGSVEAMEQLGASMQVGIYM